MSSVESGASRDARETEPVTVDLEWKALFAARAAARAKGASLSEWLSHVACLTSRAAVLDPASQGSVDVGRRAALDH
jgi:hypothetical protein